MDVDFWGVYTGTRAFLPHLIASGDGHLVNTSSVFGLFAVPSQNAYNAAKFAVRGFTELVRQEMLASRHPVKVTCVHPGGIKTDIARNATSAEGEIEPGKVQLFDRTRSLAPTGQHGSSCGAPPKAGRAYSWASTRSRWTWRSGCSGRRTSVPSLGSCAACSQSGSRSNLDPSHREVSTARFGSRVPSWVTQPGWLGGPDGRERDGIERPGRSASAESQQKVSPTRVEVLGDERVTFMASVGAIRCRLEGLSDWDCRDRPRESERFLRPVHWTRHGVRISRPRPTWRCISGALRSICSDTTDAAGPLTCANAISQVSWAVLGPRATELDVADVMRGTRLEL